MESVKSFNAELSSLYEFKPPISKAKMTALTRGAIKAIKFYKHVVQSVEKFILKCKPEYKIPGLYVIDSIVRQSRHQFGTEKDVFAPRFAKNIQQTFVNLYKCPPEDKSKIIRVLNLWQKNQVFPPDVIQPLFDLADPNNPIYKEFDAPAQTNGHNLNALPKGSPALQKTPTKTSQSNESQQGAVNLNLTDPNVLLQLQQLQRLITRSGETKNDSQVHFDKKLLDFDYGDEEEEVNPSPKPPIQNDNPVTSLLTNPEVLRQLQTLQQTMVIAQEADADKMRKLQEMKQQEEEFDKHLAQTVPNLPFAAECEFKPANPPLPPQGYYLPPPDLTQQQQQQQMVYKAQYDLNQQTDQSNYANPTNDNDNDVEVITLDHADSSRSPSPDRRRRRSRSRSRDNRRDRDRRSRRSRSRSHSRSKRHRTRSRDRDRDRKDKEKETEREKERKKRGLPAIKKENLSVCSTTLWVGHLSKLVHQDDLSNTFGEFGEIVSIDLIPPRGCAFIVMNRRQDAARCLSKLKNHVIHAKAITLAWAPGKGVKGKDFKDYWEGDLGVSYIPWSKIKRDIDLDMLEDGGMIDEETMPDWMKAKIENSSKHQNASMSMPDMTVISTTVDTSQPPPIPGAGLLQPPPMSLPLVPQFQFNNRLLAPPNMLNLPPGMIPNVPMGVPPPNIQNQLMSNPLLGINSPFQGTALIPPPPISLSSDNSQNTPENTMKNLTDSLMSLSQSFNMLNPPHQLPPPTTNIMQEESMDIEMEDARAHMEVQPPSSINHDPRTNSDRDRNREERDRDRRDNRDRDRDRDRDNKNDRNRDRDRRRSKSRERERERERERDRNRERDRDRRANSRDRGDRERDRDRDNVRGRDRRDRGRSNRWGDRDKDSDPQTDRRDRERSLNERLQEMAGGGPRSSRDRKDTSTSQSNFQQPPPPLNEAVFQNRLDNLKDQKTEKSLITEKVDDNLRSIEEMGSNPNSQTTSLDFIPGPNATMNEYHHTPGAAPIQDFVPPDMPMDGPIDGFPPMNDFGPAPGSDFHRPMGPGPGPMRPGPPDDFQGPIGFGPMGPMGPAGPINPMDEFPPMGPRGPSMDEFPPMGPRGPRDNFGPPMMDEFGPPMDNYPDDFPPHVRGRRGRMHDDRYGRRGRRDFRGSGPPRGPRGPPVPPEFFDEFGHPRDEFGPPIEEFGPPMDDFGQPMNDFGPPIDDFGPPIDDFGPPMDDFGPTRDNFRPPIDDFGPEGEFDEFAPRERFPPRGRRGGPRDFMPRMRGGPPRGFPRGPRGRGGSWNDRNFNPRFDGPPEYFRGGRPPRDMFEDGPPRRRGGRFDGDHRPPYHVEEEGGEIPPEEFRSNRKSRWGNQSPHGFRNDVDCDGPPGDEQHGADQDAEQNNGGLTPVRDEGPEGPTELHEAPSENKAEEVLAESGGGSDGVEEKQSEVAAAE